MDEAGQRVHCTTREQPLTRFALERPLMLRCPSRCPILACGTVACIVTSRGSLSSKINPFLRRTRVTGRRDHDMRHGTVSSAARVQTAM